MEVVKRLKGSEPETINYNFEEHYLEEDEQITKRKKSTLFSIITLSIIAIFGYFGFNYFKTKDTKHIETSNIVTNLLPNKKVESNQTLSTKTEETTVKQEVVISPITKESNPTIATPPKEVSTHTALLGKQQEEKLQNVNKIATYTEVLAQEIKPIIVQKKKEIVLPPKIKEKIKIVKQRPIKKKILKHIASKKSKYKVLLKTPQTITIKRGDTLALLSQKFYGSSKKFNRIIQANKSIKNHKTSLKIGQKVLIPSLTKKYKKTKIKVKKIKRTKRIRIVTIKKGDTLALIAQRFYGNAREFKRIIRANKKIRNSKTKLKYGQKIIVPYLPKKLQRRFVTVRKGFSLAYISKKFYGTTKEIEKIVKANKNIKSKKSTLLIGQKVYVPR